MDESSSDVSAIRSANWSGSIPVVLTLAPTSLSSPTVPPPLHRMVNRMTYLHVGFADEVRRLHKFAPATLAIGGYRRGGEPIEITLSSDPNQKTKSDSTAEEGDNGEKDQSDTYPEDAKIVTPVDLNYDVKYPVCWFEDESSGVALRWHLFAGVLYDLMRARRRKPDGSSNALPWRIRVHFTSYPTHQILSFADGDVLQTIEQAFNNSLKQALFLQHGSSKVAMGLSKASHQQLWDAVVGSNYNLYEEINGEGLQASPLVDGKDTGLSNIPVRVLVDGKPAIQRPCPCFAPSTNGKEQDSLRTIGDVLLEWMPHLFSRQQNSNDDSHVVAADLDTTMWTVQGIDGVPLSTPAIDIWRSLCHPDHFLYIMVVTKVDS
mmetsp:Transcript_55770/g.167125  ORF Transcript_55770/g.167125 Transcript_55770/m.167125 type:complete len:376 (+) Transcript_55770:142-1269(+)